MRYEVLDLKTGENITNKLNFSLKTNGSIAYNINGNELYPENLTVIFFPTDNEHLYIDDAGGVHDSGCRCDPDGVDCGECSFITCSECGVWANRKEEKYRVNPKNNSNSNQN